MRADRVVVALLILTVALSWLLSVAILSWIVGEPGLLALLGLPGAGILAIWISRRAYPPRSRRAPL